jgi:hypothetical protein
MVTETTEEQKKCLECGAIYKFSVYSECPVCNPQAGCISDKAKGKVKDGKKPIHNKADTTGER